MTHFSHSRLASIRSHIMASIAVVFSLTISARGEVPDSLGRITAPMVDSLPSFMLPADHPRSETTFAPLPNPITPGPLPKFNPRPLPKFNPALQISPSPAAWSGGNIAFSSSSQALPGFMGIDHGRIALNQELGKMSFSAWAGASKYGYFRGLQTSYGFGATINIALSNRWSLTAFGQYFTPLHPLSPAMAGFMQASTLGGYASYNFNDHWGISVGAQTQRSLLTNRWETAPIVKPYYRINKRIAFEIDLGGILYNVAKDYIDSKRTDYSSFPPTMAPSVPRPAPARVAPRK